MPGFSFKRFLIGKPLANERIEHERLNKKTALAVLSSDAISSVAYATDQILFVLGGAIGLAALSYVVPISAVIVGLLALVGISYRQTVRAYPLGGGSYTVAKENLGQRAGLVAAAALLIDYVLTVATSVSAGIAAITSAYPALVPHTVALGVSAILLLMVMNLRGVRESGIAFSFPTYAFIAMMLALIGLGVFKLLTGAEIATVAAPLKVDPVSAQAAGGMPPGSMVAIGFLLMRGFAEGCVAMTGTEAISNGVQVFKAPSSKNAARTLSWMIAILATFFMGVSYLAQHFAVMPTTSETVLSQLGHHVFGNGAAYYALQYSTFALLVLAANTAFADFPRLAGILANDRYMPRQLAARGDRLAFSNGIIVLALVAILLLSVFGGQTNSLIPLYAIGVFVCFTLSQAGMVMHWFRTREPGWHWRAALNGVGAVATAIVTLIQVVTKFTAGGWIVVVLIPLFIMMLQAINTHYRRFAIAVAFRGRSPILPHAHTVVVPVNSVNKAAAAALVYATTLSRNVHAVHVEVDPAQTPKVEHEWDRWDIGYELEILKSPYRSIVRPLVDYVTKLQLETPGALVTVVTPELVLSHWWEHLLHNKTALYIRTALLFKPNVVVVAVPYLLGHDYEHEGRGPRWVADSLLMSGEVAAIRKEDRE
ncbi:MAG TPA: APC family permease [Gemmatimonadaceae bacterium]|nr:APC family permease [Gemmatimonadaceae bacterium]